MVMLGAYIAKTKAVSSQSILDGLEKVLGEKKKRRFLEINKRAFKEGMEIVNL